jgi:transposase
MTKLSYPASLIRVNCRDLVVMKPVARVILDPAASSRDARSDRRSIATANPDHCSGRLYVDGYINRIQSSRRLEVETQRNIELIWLLGRLSPDHWTIAHYRKTHRTDIQIVHTKLREFLRDMGYITGEVMGVDGSKVKANARRAMPTKEKIEYRLQQADA